MTKTTKTMTLITLVLVLLAVLYVVKQVVATVLPVLLGIVAVAVVMTLAYRTKYESMYLAKLATLRQLFITALTIAESVCTKYSDTKLGAYKYPIKWLKHFLEGSGEAMEVPAELVQQAESALIRALYCDDYNTINTGSICGKFCLNHSTLYKGRGFYNRPSLFYVMGGFTFRLYRHNNGYIVSGNDYYDWHNNGDGKYFTSPLGNNMALVVKVLGIIFGEDLFVTNGWPSGECGISNKLWEEMYKVGAKSFHSYFRNVEISIDDDEYWNIISGYNPYISHCEYYDGEIEA